MEPTPPPALPLTPHHALVTEATQATKTPLLSHPQVSKAAEDATPPGRENLELDFMSEVIENNNDARSDHGGGEAAHRQPLKERANKTSPKENPWNQSNCPRPPFNMSTLTCPYETPVFRLPAPLPLPPPTTN